MLRLTFSLLLVGLVAVSAIPLNETATELLPSQTTTKTITLEDVQTDQAVEAVRSLLSLCLMDNPGSLDERKSWENALKEVMKTKNFLAFYDQFLKDVTETRKAECTPGSDPNKFTGKNSEGYKMILRRKVGTPEAEITSENDKEPSAIQQNQCEWNYFEKDGQCLPGFGASCQNNAGCAQKNLTCIQGICGCDGHYSRLSEICRKRPTELHEFCHEALPCDRIENAYCHGECMCKESYVEQNGRCVPGLGALCSKTDECNGVPNLTCVENKCAFL